LSIQASRRTVSTPISGPANGAVSVIYASSVGRNGPDRGKRHLSAGGKSTREELRNYHDSHGILTEAWAPLGQNRGLLADKRVTEIAVKNGRTPAQVVLRWHIQIGNVVIPKSVNPDRIRENIDVFDFELDQADMAAFAKLDMGLRLGPHPNEFKLV
jgi:diketogulonate reductase-like aldo/keto reductase